MQHNVITLPPQPQLPVAAVAAAIEALIDAGRRIDHAQTALIAVLDAATPDTDREETGLEDSFQEHPADGPGCPVVDVDAGAWVEWTSLRRSAKRGANSTFGDEDAEDHEGGGDTGGDEAEPDFAKRAGGYGPGCKISDDDQAVDDQPCDACSEDGL